MYNIMKNLEAFRDARNWKQYHTPEALARAISVEAGELNELFLWGNEPDNERLAEELADVMIFSLNLCIAAGLDPYQIIADKMAKNAVKYVRGDECITETEGIDEDEDEGCKCECLLPRREHCPATPGGWVCDKCRWNFYA